MLEPCSPIFSHWISSAFASTVSGRVQGQAAASARLRDAGLSSSLSGALHSPDILVSPPEPTRGPVGGFLSEPALLEMVEAVHARVGASLRADRFPVFYGGDCSVLLGAVPALREFTGTAGLLFVDGHEDATTMEQSTTGEAANVEIALLLGLTGERAPDRLRADCRPFDPNANRRPRGQPRFNTGI